MSKKVIGIFVGSLRRDSFSKKVAHYLAGALDEQFDVRFLDISFLPLYNEDLDDGENTPVEWTRFREGVKALDAVLFVTPEYNRSVPAVLKNALDVASRPSGLGVWRGKPGAAVGVSPGKIGAIAAVNHLRQTAMSLGIDMMSQPEAYIGGISSAVDDVSVSDKDMQDFLNLVASAFASWVDKLTKK